MPRMPGDGEIDHARDDDGIVHDVDYTRRSYAFSCRRFVKVYDSDDNSDECEEVIYFSYAQAKTIEADGPTTCLDCIAGNNILVR